MNPTGLAVQVRDLRKNYGHLAAVAGIDLQIAAGEVFALLGPNGAGKTTCRRTAKYQTVCALPVLYSAWATTSPKYRAARRHHDRGQFWSL